MVKFYENGWIYRVTDENFVNGNGKKVNNPLGTDPMEEEDTSIEDQGNVVAPPAGNSNVANQLSGDQNDNSAAALSGVAYQNNETKLICICFWDTNCSSHQKDRMIGKLWFP